MKTGDQYFTKTGIEHTFGDPGVTLFENNVNIKVDSPLPPEVVQEKQANIVIPSQNI